MTDTASTRLAAWEPGYRRLEEGEAIVAWNTRPTQTQAEAQQPSDGLVEELERMIARAQRETRIFERMSGAASRDFLNLAPRILAALKARTSPETTFADELAERVRRAFSNDAAALITGELSDGRRYVVMPFDHYESELLKRQKRGAEQALRTSPETVENFIKLHEEWQQAMELLRKARKACFSDALSEEHQPAREEKFGLVNRIDAHLSNTPGKEGSDG